MRSRNLHVFSDLYRWVDHLWFRFSAWAPDAVPDHLVCFWHPQKSPIGRYTNLAVFCIRCPCGCRDLSDRQYQNRPACARPALDSRQWLHPALWECRDNRWDNQTVFSDADGLPAQSPEWDCAALVVCRCKARYFSVHQSLSAAYPPLSSGRGHHHDRKHQWSAWYRLFHPCCRHSLSTSSAPDLCFHRQRYRVLHAYRVVTSLPLRLLCRSYPVAFCIGLPMLLNRRPVDLLAPDFWNSGNGQKYHRQSIPNDLRFGRSDLFARIFSLNRYAVFLKVYR